MIFKHRYLYNYIDLCITYFSTGAHRSGSHVRHLKYDLIASMFAGSVEPPPGDSRRRPGVHLGAASVMTTVRVRMTAVAATKDTTFSPFEAMLLIVVHVITDVYISGGGVLGRRVLRRWFLTQSLSLIYLSYLAPSDFLPASGTYPIFCTCNI